MFKLGEKLTEAIKKALIPTELAPAGVVQHAGCFGCSNECVSSCSGGCWGNCSGGCIGTCSGSTR